MSAEPRAGWRFSLRMKLLAVLIPVTAISLLVAMVGLGNFLHDLFQRSAEAETAQLGQAVELALRQSMLRKPELALSDTLADVQKTPSIRRIWVIDKNGRVAHASDRSAVGKVLDKEQDSICRTCHANRASPNARTLFVRDEASVPILRHVRPIPNEEACWGCHDSNVRLNGILLVEESTHTYRGALWTVERRIGATGAITLIVLAAMIVLVTTILVQRPVRRLMAGMRQVGGGNLSFRIPVHGRDELAELANSFNGMAAELGSSIEEVRNRNTELSVVYSIVERLTETIDLGDLKEIILRTVLDVFGADRVLLVSNVNSQSSRDILMRTSDANRTSRFQHTCEGESVLPENFPSVIVSRWLDGELTTPFLAPDNQKVAIPIQVRDKRLGLLLIERERRFAQPEANHKLLDALADHIGMAFENARLYTMAITDELTQVFTVRHFRNRIEEGVARCESCQQKLGLLMLDLDHFKAINDRWGHVAGDEVLRQVAQVLLNTIRVGDSAYRYGGEEFAILLAEADLVTSRAVAERIRQAIEHLEIPLGGGEKVAITASIGMAIYPDQGQACQELVTAADTALYAAKAAGRNRVSGPLAPLPR